MATFYHHETARPHIFFNNVDKLLGVQATKSWPKYKTGVSKYFRVLLEGKEPKKCTETNP